jgi:hypothetical protein
MSQAEGSEMSVLSTKTKARVGVKTAKQAAKHPKLARRGAQVAKPVVGGAVRRKARHQAAAVVDAGRSVGETVFEAGRQAALDAAPEKRTAPWLALGIAIGAALMYLLDPTSGGDRRRTVMALLPGNGSGHDDQRAPDSEAGGPAHPGPGHMPPEHG